MSKIQARHLFAALAVAAATLAAFWPVLHNGFLYYDDAVYFLRNPYYRGLGWDNLKWMWTTRYYGAYQPLSWMTLGLDYVLCGLRPFGYHLTNLLFHALNAALFYFLSLALLRAARPGENSEALLALASAFAALVFAAHPLRVESVAWISERRDVLSCAFYLGTLLLYLKAARTNQNRARVMGAALACYFLALCAKGVVVTLPLVLVLLDVYPLKRLPGRVSRWADPDLRLLWREKIPFFILAAIFGSLGLLGLSQASAMNSLAARGLAPRLAASFYSLTFYLGKTMAPIHLSPLYPVPVHFNPWAWRYVLSAAAAIAITAAAFLARRRAPWLLAAWAYYAIVLIPMMGLFVSFKTYLTADRYSYLSCMGWAVLAGAGALVLLKRLRGTSRAAAVAALGAVVLVLARLTHAQAKVWRDPQTLWSSAVAQDPDNAVALSNLGAIWEQAGEHAKAAALDERALAVDPSVPEIYANLGVALQNEGDLRGAVAAYEQAITYGDSSPVIRQNLALALKFLRRAKAGSR